MVCNGAMTHSAEPGNDRSSGRYPSIHQTAVRETASRFGTAVLCYRVGDTNEWKCPRRTRRLRIGFSINRKPRVNSTVDAESTLTAHDPRGSSSFDADQEIESFPSLFVRPIEREINAVAMR